MGHELLDELLGIWRQEHDDLTRAIASTRVAQR